MGDLALAVLQEEIDWLKASNAELLAVCEALAKFKVGPAKNAQAEWIGRVLELAEQAREAVAQAKL